MWKLDMASIAIFEGDPEPAIPRPGKKFGFFVLRWDFGGEDRFSRILSLGHHLLQADVTADFGDLLLQGRWFVKEDAFFGLAVEPESIGKSCNSRFLIEVVMWVFGMAGMAVFKGNVIRAFGFAEAGGSMGVAQSIFNLMAQPDVILLNSLISGYLNNDRIIWSLLAFFWKWLHGLSVSMGFVYDVVAGSILVDMHAKCKILEDSCHVFLEMPVRNWISWSVVTAGCVQNDQLLDSFELFKEMQQEGVEVSLSIYASIFRPCAGFSSLRFGSQMHGHALKNNFASDVIVGTSVLDIYLKCDNTCMENVDLWSKRALCFDVMDRINVASWNAIVVAYEHIGYGEETLELFCLMLRSGMEPDEFSSGSVIKACTGFSLQKQREEAQKFFSRMLDMGLTPNICTYATVLDACANLAIIGLGKKRFMLRLCSHALSHTG
ncbi:hypothetical protein GIB67_014949 [Kingdonia uniflora]|uniref:Pentatricopeptide repeat-containing protein n=1 Tax=Kingdonia uniflora TaxID=39325 RepID=A0A7J7MTB7_9MAGN|nr:hypothetical protein GIB67_014949 [Kingdonia uniflora]